MQKGLVSVVIPIYNVEKYLNQCIESVVNQTYRNIEILLIDDGSLDGCPQICDEWAKKDSRIKVVHKENAGLGMARNTGIDNAVGEYICFFDSDDFISLNTIEKAYATATEQKVDVVVFGMTTTNSEGVVLNQTVPPNTCLKYENTAVIETFLPEYIAPNYIRNGVRFYMSACLALYSMELIKRSGWRFVSERDIISEDVYSLLALFKHVNRVAVLPEALYFYRTNTQSLSRRYQKGRYEKVRHFYLKSAKLCKTLEYGENIINRITQVYFSFTLAAMKQESVASLSLKERRKNLKSIIKDDVLQCALQKYKKEKTNLAQKILFFAIRKKLYNITFGLLWGKAKFS